MFRAFIVFLSSFFAWQQQPTAPPDPDIEFVCPMDKDVRSNLPGKCPRCGMTLVAGIPDAHEFPVHITTAPKILRAGEETLLTFHIEDPATEKAVRDFEIMHEKLFHLFLISQDMQFFRHVHPIMQQDGTFDLDVNFPHPGLYRVLSDFYPKGATPQLVATTLFVPGAGMKMVPAKLTADLAPNKTANMEVSLTTEPAEPIAGMKTLMFFRLTPSDGVEPYIGAMGHMLAASSDLIDLIHTHPFLVGPDNGPFKQIQFNMIFPREGIYRVWVQFQRKGVVNTAVFNVPVTVLK
ncbi:MAG: heavy metal-binding domain-containing protein [Bryobacteraceae bacterium]